MRYLILIPILFIMGLVGHSDQQRQYMSDMQTTCEANIDSNACERLIQLVEQDPRAEVLSDAQGHYWTEIKYCEIY